MLSSRGRAFADLEAAEIPNVVNPTAAIAPGRTVLNRVRRSMSVISVSLPNVGLPHCAQERSLFCDLTTCQCVATFQINRDVLIPRLYGYVEWICSSRRSLGTGRMELGFCAAFE